MNFNTCFICKVIHKGQWDHIIKPHTPLWSWSDADKAWLLSLTYLDEGEQGCPPPEGRGPAYNDYDSNDDGGMHVSVKR